MDDSLRKAQDKYEKSEKGKARKKRHRDKTESKEKERGRVRDRAEYMKEYRRRKKLQNQS